MKDKQTELDRINNYKKVFATPEAKEVLKDHMLRYFIATGTYDPDPHKMYFREGQRGVVAELLEILHIDPHTYAKYLEEISDEANSGF